MTTPLLSVDDVHAGYGKREVLRGLSFELAEGEVVALLGGNGSGKSTTLRVISGLLRPTAGRVRFESRTISDLLPNQVRALGIGLLLQGGRVFPNLTTAENLEVSTQGVASGTSKGSGLLFPQLERFLTARAGLLSGGERQMLAIEMILAGQPQLLLLDEPSAGLAPNLVGEVLARLREYVTETGVSVLLVEQKVEEALQICDRSLHLVEGSVEPDADVTH